ncbi:hypothetical protein CANMA_002161 [Candida margitis]|uniref:uncharacterized protein n=1 Tax=Candida margitis TaxID=1775924 RepID=UPI002226CBC9|nr:uncharacterized protein CANMA_002161 [Candida margitis]KAI5968725.1 hypothetical protein CANMA_002161 [Candida margitis]
MNQAEKLKNEGNEAFKRHEYKKAAKIYRDAIQLDMYNPVLYSNRAQCFLNLGDYERALDDTTSGLNLGGQGKVAVKLNYRRAMTLLELNQMQGAKGALQSVLQLDPQNHTAKKQLADLEATMERNGTLKDIIISRQEKPFPLAGSKSLNASSLPSNSLVSSDGEIGEQCSSDKIPKRKNEPIYQKADNVTANKLKHSSTESATTPSPMRYLLALKHLNEEKKIHAYKYILNLESTAYTELFQDTGIDAEFLEFYLHAARYVFSNKVIEDPEHVVLDQMTLFSSFKGYDLALGSWDSSLKQQTLNIIEEKFPQLLNQYRQLIK